MISNVLSMYMPCKNVMKSCAFSERGKFGSFKPPKQYYIDTISRVVAACFVKFNIKNVNKRYLLPYDDQGGLFFLYIVISISIGTWLHLFIYHINGKQRACHEIPHFEATYALMNKMNEM